MQADRQTDKQTEDILTHRGTHTERHMQTDNSSCCLHCLATTPFNSPESFKPRRTIRQTDRHAYIQKHRQTNRQTDDCLDVDMDENSLRDRFVLLCSMCLKCHEVMTYP